MDSPSNTTTDNKDQTIIEDSSASIENQDTTKSEGLSASETQEDKRTTLDLVKEAIASTDSSSKTEGNKDKDTTESKDKPDGESKDEDDDSEDEDKLKAAKSQMKADTRERFEKLQKRDFEKKQRIVELEGKLKEVEADAGWKSNFDGYLRSNNISMDEANVLFDIGALMKNNPQKALEALTPYYNQLLQVTGNILPPDLAQQVKDGYINETHAYQIARQNAQLQHNNVLQQRGQYQQEQTNQENHNKLVNDIQQAINATETKWQKSDPDYKLKSSRIQDKMKLTWFDMSRTGQMPKSVDEAVQIAERVKKEVEKELRQYSPKRPVSTVNSGGSFSQSKPDAKSTLDIIRQSRGS